MSNREKYRCRSIVPPAAQWMEVEAVSHTDAAQEYLLRNSGQGKPSLRYSIETDNTRELLYAAKIEVEGHGSFVARVFQSGLWRRGGVRRPPEYSVADIELMLGLEHGTLLDDSKWEDAETYDEALVREGRCRLSTS